jgi:hypothetical protein
VLNNIIFNSPIKFTDFAELKDVLEVFTDENRTQERMKLFHEGIPYTGERVNISENGRIIYELQSGGDIHHVVLYVNYQKIDEATFHLIQPEDLNRYHFYNCEHIENILKSGYQMTISAKQTEGLPYHFKNLYGEEIYHNKDVEILPCERCLEIFNHQHQSNIPKEEFKKSYIYSSIK